MIVFLVCGLKSFFNGQIIGSKIDYKVLDCLIIDYRYKLKVKGDKADVFKTSLLAQYQYPEINGEKWCPLSLIWNRIGSIKKVRYFAEPIYYAEYLDDGMSLNRLNIRRNSPNTTMLYYKELANYNIPKFQKFKALVNYWRFSFYSNSDIKNKIKAIGVIKSLFFFPFGLLLYLIDQQKSIHDKFLDPKRRILKKQR